MPKAPEPDLSLRAILADSKGFVRGSTLLKIVDYIDRTRVRPGGHQFKVSNNHDGTHIRLKDSYLNNAVVDINHNNGFATHEDIRKIEFPPGTQDTTYSFTWDDASRDLTVDPSDSAPDQSQRWDWRSCRIS